MEHILVDEELSMEKWQTAIEELFPELCPIKWQFLCEDAQRQPNTIYYSTDLIAEHKEFQWLLETGISLQGDVNRCEQQIAQRLSYKYSVRTMVGFDHPNHPGDPYYSIVFVNGQSFLADDVEFGVDEEGYSGLVKIIGPYELRL